MKKISILSPKKSPKKIFQEMDSNPFPLKTTAIDLRETTSCAITYSMLNLLNVVCLLFPSMKCKIFKTLITVFNPI